jgi:hypothetical protein
VTLKKAREQLKEWMQEDLPSITKQKRYIFRPSVRQINHTYKVLNIALFDGTLKKPKIKLVNRQRYWGMCQALNNIPIKYKSRSNCELVLSDKWFCRQWFIDTLAHEMVHQYQWDVDGPVRIAKGKEALMSHGPSFFRHKPKLDRYGLNLKIVHRTRKWFKYQNLAKC